MVSSFAVNRLSRLVRHQSVPRRYDGPKWAQSRPSALRSGVPLVQPLPGGLVYSYTPSFRSASWHYLCSSSFSLSLGENPNPSTTFSPSESLRSVISFLVSLDVQCRPLHRCSDSPDASSSYERGPGYQHKNMSAHPGKSFCPSPAPPTTQPSLRLCPHR